MGGWLLRVDEWFISWRQLSAYPPIRLSDHRPLPRLIMKFLALLVLLTAIAPSLAAQDFRPPDEDKEPSKVKIGLTGFGARAGVDFKGTSQLVSSITLDVADLYSDRIRVRPSGEIGIGGGVNTYLANLDVM